MPMGVPPAWLGSDNKLPKKRMTKTRRKLTPMTVSPLVQFLTLLSALILVLRQLRSAISYRETRDTFPPPRRIEDRFSLLERRAKEEQERFCEDFAAPGGNASLEVGATPITTTLISCEPIINQSEPFAMEVYENRDIVSQALINQGRWDPDKTISMVRAIEGYANKHNLSLSNLTFVDIGANVGWFTMAMASIGMNVVAFEPMPFNLYLLRKNLCLPQNKHLASRIIIHGYGFSTVNETCIVYSDNYNMGDGHIKCTPDPTQFVPPRDYSVRALVPMARIDDLFSTKGKRIVAVKMDTEGYEANAVKGGPILFQQSKIPFIFSEFSVTVMKEKGGDPIEFIRSFLDAGYTVAEEGSSAPFDT